MTYVDFIDLTAKKKNSNLDGYQKGFVSMVYKFFLKKNL